MNILGVFSTHGAQAAGAVKGVEAAQASQAAAWLETREGSGEPSKRAIPASFCTRAQVVIPGKGAAAPRTLHLLQFLSLPARSKVAQDPTQLRRGAVGVYEHGPFGNPQGHGDLLRAQPLLAQLHDRPEARGECLDRRLDA